MRKRIQNPVLVRECCAHRSPREVVSIRHLHYQRAHMLQKRSARWHVQLLVLWLRLFSTSRYACCKRTHVVSSLNQPALVHELRVMVHIHLPLEQLVEALRHRVERDRMQQLLVSESSEWGAPSGGLLHSPTLKPCMQRSTGTPAFTR